LADLALVRVGEPFPAQIGIAILGLTQPPIWPGDKVIVIGGGIPFRGLHETGVNREAALVATGLLDCRLPKMHLLLLLRPRAP
jgi:hypothetical protein